MKNTTKKVNPYKFRIPVRNSSNGRGSTITVSQDFWTSGRGCEYDQYTLAYAACRMIKHCPNVADALVKEATWLGVRSKPKSFYHKIHAGSDAIQIPGREATVFVSVLQGQIQVTGMSLA